MSFLRRSCLTRTLRGALSRSLRIGNVSGNAVYRKGSGLYKPNILFDYSFKAFRISSDNLRKKSRLEAVAVRYCSRLFDVFQARSCLTGTLKKIGGDEKSSERMPPDIVDSKVKQPRLPRIREILLSRVVYAGANSSDRRFRGSQYSAPNSTLAFALEISLFFR